MNDDTEQDFIYIQQASHKLNDNLQQLQVGSRLERRFCHSNIWYRIVIIKINQNQIIEQLKNLKKTTKKSISNIQNQIQREYELQCRVDSNYVLKYMSMNRINNKVTFIQQDYSCLLSELELSNLNLQERFQLFQSIVKGVKDIHDKMICLRFLNPKSIAICIQDGKCIGKIKNMQAATTVINRNDFSYDTKAIPIILEKQKQYGFWFVSPQVRRMGRHGTTSDIWSLGSIFNYILYENLSNIKQDNKKVTVQVPQKTPNWLKKILESMLSFQPESRPLLSTILQVIKNSFKCTDMLQKIIPFGKKQRGSKICKCLSLIL